MDKRLKEAVGYAVSATMKGSMFDPGKAPDMLTGLQILQLEEAAGRSPLTRKELLEAAGEYADQLEAARELVPA